MRVLVCRLCGASHWSTQPHDVKGVEPRDVARVFGRARVESVVVPEAVKRVPVKVEVPLCEGPDCDEEVVAPKRGPRGKFCSDRCRKRRARLEEGE